MAVAVNHARLVSVARTGPTVGPESARVIDVRRPRATILFSMGKKLIWIVVALVARVNLVDGALLAAIVLMVSAQMDFALRPVAMMGYRTALKPILIAADPARPALMV